MKPSIVDFIAPDPVVVVLPQTGYSEAEAIKAARERFDAYTGSGRRCESAHVFRWSGTPPIDDAGLASLSRVYDITVVGRPGVGRNEPRMTTLEAALFESGRPILMAPPTPPQTIGTNVLVHWNASTETARVIHDALRDPQARRAGDAAVGRGQHGARAQAADMLGYLARHGIKGTEAYVKPATKGGAGEAILVEARKIGADLILKGAYTQSRLQADDLRRRDAAHPAGRRHPGDAVALSRFRWGEVNDSYRAMEKRERLGLSLFLFVVCAWPGVAAGSPIRTGSRRRERAGVVLEQDLEVGAQAVGAADVGLHQGGVDAGDQRRYRPG